MVMKLKVTTTMMMMMMMMIKYYHRFKRLYVIYVYYWNDAKKIGIHKKDETFLTHHRNNTN